MKHLPRIDIQAISHKKHRYETVGDYWERFGVTHFRVSKMGDPRYEFLVLMHELTEYFLVKQEGVTIKSIDDFDIAYEKNRKLGDLSEPGDHRAAPYFAQHQHATQMERLLAAILKVDWKEYEAHLNNL